MKTYEAHVTGVIGRTVTVQAENKEAAESKAIQEFKSLTGVEDEVGIDDIEDVTPGPQFNRLDPDDSSTWIECQVHSIDPAARTWQPFAKPKLPQKNRTIG